MTGGGFRMTGGMVQNNKRMVEGEMRNGKVKLMRIEN